MKTNLTSRRRQLSRARFNPLHAIAAAGLLLAGPCTVTSGAEQILIDAPLLNAPSANYSFYGMYSPYVTAASFTLSSSFYVSMIGVELRTPAATSFTTFHFSLQSALADPITIFASEDLTASLGVASTQIMNVNETLPAGTYYLAGIVPGYAGSPVTPGDVDGWMLSTGVYSGMAGTIVDGLWSGNPSTFLHASGYVAPAFSVIGFPVPEPSAWLLLAAGVASLPALRHRKQV
ncbi:MAG TPA: hypothetical protein VKV04_01525 [Verrucomicrobiae bacterium]|nr:hypothetical protein [Verrucomicrobiae bacterium]